jgi:pimeloyl-ACP methyl ester carboxylesterase
MPADAGFYAVLTRRLAANFTVVAYDPRGMSRSRLDGPPSDQLVPVHADDARRVLDAVEAGPAHVLGDSISGLVGLELAATAAGQVRTLVAFEPPLTELLPDRERWRAFIEELHQTYRRDGLYPALQRFGEGVGLGAEEEPEPPRQGDPDPEVAAALGRMEANMDLWLEHVVRPSFMGYRPDIGRLRAGGVRIVVVVGDRSGPRQMAFRTSHALAGQLGTAPVAFGGDHNAVTTHPEAFAATLEELLGRD